ncbi:hypothetical protein ASE48_20700 [Mycobacterium sp. Root265]|nr:hypothetical protein ASE48_20700 [Mycobacterium sp. Root265]
MLSEAFGHQGVAQDRFDGVVVALGRGAVITGRRLQVTLDRWGQGVSEISQLAEVAWERPLLDRLRFRRWFGFAAAFAGRLLFERVGHRIVLGFRVVGVVDPRPRPHVQDGAQVGRELRIHPPRHLRQSIDIGLTDREPHLVPRQVGAVAVLVEHVDHLFGELGQRLGGIGLGDRDQGGLHLGPLGRVEISRGLLERGPDDCDVGGVDGPGRQRVSACG